MSLTLNGTYTPGTRDIVPNRLKKICPYLSFMESEASSVRQRQCMKRTTNDNKRRRTRKEEKESKRRERRQWK